MLTASLIFRLLLSSTPIDCQLVDYTIGNAKGQALVCKPGGEGPFPVVIYNHGAIVDFRGYDGAQKAGYDMKGICRQLAEDGFLAFAPIRQSGRSGPAMHLAEIQRAIDYVKTMPQADTTRMALMGFSRGGALTLTASFQRPEIRTIVLEAPAFRPKQVSPLLATVDSLAQTVLLLIEKSDDAGFIRSLAILDTLLTERGARVQRIMYDRGGGHRLFWKVDYYWDNIRAYLKERLQKARTKKR
ncbi:MAG: dienelactone hydrolase family protein [candidate division KSB1 bacterium]|nr:dienelactone hydrolase family protein [candidate division KSB1 bacterium]MDQ7063652.1 dienelactone hydrolase family protein [candidate division KSB1 bacterium]